MTKKAEAFSSAGTEDKRSFVPARNATYEVCNCRIAFKVATMFLNSGRPLIIEREGRVDFDAIASKDIGQLLIRLANIRGRGRIIVSQSDMAEIIIERLNPLNMELTLRARAIMKDFFGFAFRERKAICEKCEFDSDLLPIIGLAWIENSGEICVILF